MKKNIITLTMTLLMVNLNCNNPVNPDNNLNDLKIGKYSFEASYIICEYQDSALYYDTLSQSFLGEVTENLDQKWHPISSTPAGGKTFSGGRPGGPIAIILKTDCDDFNDSSIYCSIRLNWYTTDTFRLVDSRFSEKCITDSMSTYTLFILKPAKFRNFFIMGDNIIKFNLFDLHDSYSFYVHVDHIIQRTLLIESDSLGNALPGSFWNSILENSDNGYTRICFKSDLEVIPGKMSVTGYLKDSSEITQYVYSNALLNPQEFKYEKINDTLYILSVNFKPLEDSDYFYNDFIQDTISSQMLSIEYYQANNWSKERIAGEIGIKKN